jgi:hypothetical protein
MIQETIYDRQNRISELDIPKVASVVGCGGTGFWTAVFLAMSGVEELILVDPDSIELSNLNRLPLEEGRAGEKKTLVTRDFINGIRKTVRIETHECGIAKPEDCTMLRGVIFCCTDSLNSQQLICAYCNKNNLKYQRIGYDGTILNVSKAFPLSFEDTNNQRGYTITPSWVVPAVLAASAGVASILYKELCLMDDIGKIHVQGCSYVCRKILDDAMEEGKEEILDNIHDYIPDDYGNCSDCNRIDPDDSGYGYCEDCDQKYSEDEIEDIKQEAEETGFNNAIAQIESGNIEDSALRNALKAWKEKQEVRHE